MNIATFVFLYSPGWFLQYLFNHHRALWYRMVFSMDLGTIHQTAEARRARARRRPQ